MNITNVCHSIFSPFDSLDTILLRESSLIRATARFHDGAFRAALIEESILEANAFLDGDLKSALIAESILEANVNILYAGSLQAFLITNSVLKVGSKLLKVVIPINPQSNIPTISNNCKGEYASGPTNIQFICLKYYDVEEEKYLGCVPMKFIVNNGKTGAYLPAITCCRQKIF